jgi:hypothetical protein
MSQLFAVLVYGLCFLTSSACAGLLLTSYRRTGARLLLWSGGCFLLLAANNLVVIVDLLIIPQIDFRIHRLLLSLGAVAILLFGFIWDLREDANE